MSEFDGTGVRFTSCALTMSKESRALIGTVKEAIAVMEGRASKLDKKIGEKLLAALDAWEDSELYRLKEIYDKKEEG